MRRTFISSILITLVGLGIPWSSVWGQTQHSLSMTKPSATSGDSGTRPQEYGAETEQPSTSRYRSGQRADLSVSPQLQDAPRVLPPPGFSSDSAAHSARAIDHRATSHGTAPTTNSFVKTSVIVICLLVLAIVVARVLKKHGPISIVGLPEDAVEILGKRPIDRQKAIHLVRCGSRILVLGTSVNGINTLAEITDPIEVDFLAGVCHHKENETGMAHSFRHLFRKQVSSISKTPSPKATVPLTGDEPFPVTSANDRLRQTIAG